MTRVFEEQTKEGNKSGSFEIMKHFTMELRSGVDEWVIGVEGKRAQEGVAGDEWVKGKRRIADE